MIVNLFDEMEISDAATVLSLLRGIHEGIGLSEGRNIRMIYRGVGNDAYDLTPTAFRPEGKSILQNMFAASGVKEDAPNNSQTSQGIRELNALGKFYSLANEQGLSLPCDNQGLHTELSSSVIGLDNLDSVSRFYNSVNLWPQKEVLPVMALAQHYGIPTRILDWTYDPIIAALFATRSALRRISASGSEEGKFSIWYVNKVSLSATQIFERHKEIDTPRYSIATIDAPYNGNPNLAAQKGTFTIVYRQGKQEPNDPVDKTAVNEAVVKIFEDTHGVPQQEVIFSNPEKSLFNKITIPLSQAKKLQRHILAAGYHAGTLFPGFQGCADALIETIQLNSVND